MAICPNCDHDISTPSFLNLNVWSSFVCPYCKARLEMKSPRSVALGPLMIGMFVLARQGRVFEIIAFVFMFVTIFLLLLESMRPKVQLRKKPLPKPTIRLNIDGPQN